MNLWLMTIVDCPKFEMSGSINAKTVSITYLCSCFITSRSSSELFIKYNYISEKLNMYKTSLTFLFVLSEILCFFLR